MRAIDKMELISKIGRELQSRFTADDLVAFLNVSGLCPPPYSDGSKWVYVKNVLLGESLETINKIANELEIRGTGGPATELARHSCIPSFHKPHFQAQGQGDPS